MPMLHAPIAVDGKGNLDIEDVLQRRIAQIRFDDFLRRAGMLIGVNEFVIRGGVAKAGRLVKIAIELVPHGRKSLKLSTLGSWKGRMRSATAWPGSRTMSTSGTSKNGSGGAGAMSRDRRELEGSFRMSSIDAVVSTPWTMERMREASSAVFSPAISSSR